MSSTRGLIVMNLLSCLLCWAPWAGEPTLAAPAAPLQLAVSRTTDTPPTLVWNDNGSAIPLGRLDLGAADAGWHSMVQLGKVASVRSVDGRTVIRVSLSGKWTTPDSVLECTFTPSGDRVHANCRLVGLTSDDIPAVANLMLRYPEPAERAFEPVSTTGEHHGVITLTYPGARLELQWPDDMLSRARSQDGFYNMKLTADAWRALIGKGLSWSMTLRHDTRGLSTAAGQAMDGVEDLKASLQAARIWELGASSAQASRALADLESQVKALTERVPDAGRLADADAERRFRDALLDLHPARQKLEEKIQSFLADHRDELYARVKAMNRTMRFGAGLAYDKDPSSQFLNWALFNLSIFRMDTTPDRLGIADTAERYARVRQILAEADRFGARTFLVVRSEPVLATGPEDLTYTQDLVPTIRPSFFEMNFNSRRAREAMRRGVRETAEQTRSIPNIADYQIDNEPFWSTRADPILGYDPTEIGCSNATWREQVRRRYGTFDHWLASFKPSVGRGSPQGYIKGGSMKSLYTHWHSIDDMTFDPDAGEGLTFVDYLKQRYGTLDKLNAAWFADDHGRWLKSWDEVFPPTPIIGKKVDLKARPELASVDFPAQWFDRSGSRPRARPQDVAAWMDWTLFWPHCVGDALASFRDAMHEGGAKAPATTNAIFAHFVNNLAGTAAASGGSPWISPAGLDSVSIDFYTTMYLQAYMAALRSAANGRPIFIHETAGPFDGYVSLYSFAYGADAMEFWRHDNRIAPREALPLLRASRAMADADLQQRSHPVTDGVAAMYSLDSVAYADAVSGDAEPYLREFQGDVCLLTRMQVLYDVYADQQFADGVPGNVRVLLATGAYSLSDEALGALHKFVQRGGVLVTDASLGLFDNHGRPRPAADRAWLTATDPHIILLPTGALGQWRGDKLDRSAKDPYGWAQPLPKCAADVERILQQHAPRTVTYLDNQGQLAPRAAAARATDDGKLFAFLDPHAGPTTLVAHGAFARAVNLYTGKTIPLTRQGQAVRVRLDAGPAIVRFEP